MPTLTASIAPLQLHPTTYDFEGLVGDHPLMRALYAAVPKAARARGAVLIYGESGTGKEAVAHAIHAHSRQRSGPLVRFNCGLLTPETAVSQLFGHVRGAFTGAQADKEGLFHAANGGILVLDEVAEIPLVVQAMLLRALEEDEVLRLGASRPERVRVRVVASTNVDLFEAVRQGRFRMDLLARLNGVVLRLPPLRERMSDVPRLAEHFLLLAQGELGHRFCLSEAALAKLMAHDFPCNVRELEMVLEHAASSMGECSLIGPDDIVLTFWQRMAPTPAANARPDLASPPSVRRTLREVIHHEFTQALERNHHNQSQAARELGVGRSTMRWFVATGEVRVFGKRR